MRISDWSSDVCSSDLTTIVLIGTLRANGSVVPPLIILFLSMFPIRLGIYYFGYSTIGSDILWWSFPLSSLASLALAWIVYKRGGWRRPMQIGSASCRERVGQYV